MKLGDVLRKEREGSGLSRVPPKAPEEMAKALGLAPKAYKELESGSSEIETWFPILCNLAVKYGRPTSRLIAESGKSADAKPKQAGSLIRLARENKGWTVEEAAEAMGMSAKEYVTIEAGESPIETIGPLMLHFAELIDQPVFNLFLPCGVPYDELDDYP